MKKLSKILSLAFTVILALICLIGCQSTDRSETYFNHTKFSQAVYEYNEDKNETKVSFIATVRNDTIYKLKNFTLNISFYNEGELVDTEALYSGTAINSGRSYTSDYILTIDGKVDVVKFDSLETSHASFWLTYLVWICIFGVQLILYSVMYIINMIYYDNYLNDMGKTIGDFMSNQWYLATLMFGSTIFGFLWGAISGRWVIMVIDVIAIAGFFAIILIAHSIKAIFDGGYCLGTSSTTTSAEVDNDDGQTKRVKNKKGSMKTLEELDALVGLSGVKKQIRRIRALLIKSNHLKGSVNLHMCFYGDPGTGKTIVARLIANIFYETGILPTNNLVETDGRGLIAEYVGQTAPLVDDMVEEAMGGVLFIDEAYTLAEKDNGRDFGKEAVARLLQHMENRKGEFCVILAGYKKETEEMLSLNPGFGSRINRKIEFPNYSLDELMQIFNMMLSEREYTIADDAKAKVKEILKTLSEQKDEKFANARTVRNVLDSLIEIQAERTIDNLDDTNITLLDVENYLAENKHLTANHKTTFGFGK